jgi:hypothetical protein
MPDRGRISSTDRICSEEITSSDDSETTNQDDEDDMPLSPWTGVMKQVATPGYMTTGSDNKGLFVAAGKMCM